MSFHAHTKDNTTFHNNSTNTTYPEMYLNDDDEMLNKNDDSTDESTKASGRLIDPQKTAQ